MQFFDPYTLRARIYPSLVVALPFGLVLFALLPGQPIFVTALCGLLGTLGGTAVVAQLGRELGRRKQPKLWESWGGPPTTRLLRHRRILGDVVLETGLRLQVEDWVGYPLPTQQEEDACPTWADVKYKGAVDSLIAATRDVSRFPLVFSENTNYGFRRNLWGMRPIGTSVSVVLSVVSLSIFSLTVWGRPWPDPWWDVFVNPDSVALIRLVIAVVETALAAFWVLWVKPAWVKVVADTYALRLFESIHILKNT